MSLYTKSVQSPIEASDGIRVCIMRRPDPSVSWDIWMPHLAPSHDLLTEYHTGEMTWDQFVERFQKEVIEAQRDYFSILIEIAKKRTITILCWEVNPAECHRTLVANRCKEIDPTLEVTIR